MTTIDAEHGSIAFERAAFDSDIFGFSIGRVTRCDANDPAALAQLHASAIERARAEGLSLLWRTVLAEHRAEVAALERTGYGLVDVGVTFDHDLRGVAPALHPGEGFRVADERDVERIVATSATLFRTSRYYNDPALSIEGADEVHRRWIWNCFRGRADAILVDADVTSFVTCGVKDRVGSIALFGVATGAQGKGAGQRLLGAALAWFAARADRVEVKTQAHNYPAARMYERAGFRLVRSDLTYGRRLGS
jgi:dTDP-4-amino-4,6-dideoxy-D-galactose acyltransferase